MIGDRAGNVVAELWRGTRRFSGFGFEGQVNGRITVYVRVGVHIDWSGCLSVLALSYASLLIYATIVSAGTRVWDSGR
jgi:hypothetical protein